VCVTMPGCMIFYSQCITMNLFHHSIAVHLYHWSHFSRSLLHWFPQAAFLALVSQTFLSFRSSSPSLTALIFIAAPPPPPPMIRNGARDAPPPPPPYRMHGSEPPSRGKPPPPPSRTPAGPPPPPPPPLRNGHRDSITTVRSFLGK
jgi:hypothetical protein